MSSLQTALQKRSASLAKHRQELNKQYDNLKLGLISKALPIAIATSAVGGFTLTHFLKRKNKASEQVEKVDVADGAHSSSHIDKISSINTKIVVILAAIETMKKIFGLLEGWVKHFNQKTDVRSNTHDE